MNNINELRRSGGMKLWRFRDMIQDDDWNMWDILHTYTGQTGESEKDDGGEFTPGLSHVPATQASQAVSGPSESGRSCTADTALPGLG